MLRQGIFFVMVAMLLVACGNDSDQTAEQDIPAAGSPADGGTSAPTSERDGSSGDDEPPIFGQFACEDPTADGFLEVELEGPALLTAPSSARSSVGARRASSGAPRCSSGTLATPPCCA